MPNQSKMDNQTFGLGDGQQALLHHSSWCLESIPNLSFKKGDFAIPAAFCWAFLRFVYAP